MQSESSPKTASDFSMRPGMVAFAALLRAKPGNKISELGRRQSEVCRLKGGNGGLGPAAG
jgi:hypothetical protein